MSSVKSEIGDPFLTILKVFIAIKHEQSPSFIGVTLSLKYYSNLANFLHDVQYDCANSIFNRVFPKLYKVDNIVNKGLHWKVKNKFSQKILKVGIEPRTC